MFGIKYRIVYEVGVYEYCTAVEYMNIYTAMCIYTGYVLCIQAFAMVYKEKRYAFI